MTQRQALMPQEVIKHKPTHKMRAGVGILLGIFVSIVVASLVDPQSLLHVAGKSLEAVQDNLDQQTVPRKANAEVEFKPKDQRVMIQDGATIYKMAIDAYGANTVLGMDLIKEFNPQIDNLNWVFAGKDLLLPSLTRETLLRQQPDGSYHLIVASFRRRTEADALARFLRNKGYQITITPRRVSDDLSLHRVEIGGLKNLEEANQLWQTGVRSEWLAVAGNSAGTR